MGRSGRKNSEGQGLVTILFVLGVIGWGFFAIDRLTDSDKGQRAPKIQGRASGQEAGWKKSMRDWFTRSFGAQEQNRVSTESVSRNVGEIPLLPEPEGLKPDNEHELLTGRGIGPKVEQSGQEVPVYFYRLNSRGQPVLSEVRRQWSAGKSDLLERLRLVIRGPSSAEVEKDYIDSFIRKPRILSASLRDGCALVDFDSNFGAGVSHQTLKFQIRQLFRNIQAWTGDSCLELTIRGKYQSHLGSDGMYFPRRIDARWVTENF